MNKFFGLMTIFALTVITVGCETMPTMGTQGALLGGALGAGAGAIIGNNTGHHNAGTGALIGGALGALGGKVIGDELQHRADVQRMRMAQMAAETGQPQRVIVRDNQSQVQVTASAPYEDAQTHKRYTRTQVVSNGQVIKDEVVEITESSQTTQGYAGSR